VSAQGSEGSKPPIIPKFNYRIVADLAHELRTPVGGIMGMNELLLMQLNEPEEQMFAQSIDSSSRTLLAMLIDIVDLAKLENESVPLVLKPLSIDDLVDYCKFTLTPLLVAEGTDLEIVHDGGHSRQLEGDLGRIKQLICCLVLAAYKYTGSGTITLKAKVEPSTVKLSVQLPPNTVPRDGKFIFSQLENQNCDTKRFDMTWVRLRLATRLMELMNAKFKVENKEVVIELPL